MTPPLIECRNLTVYRGARRALDRISLTIATGEHVAILGPNGCGKSTLIKTLSRDLYPYQGDGPAHLRILGREVWDVATLRSMLGIVTNDLVGACVRGLSCDSDGSRRVTGRDTVLSGFFSSIGLWSHHEVTPEMEQRADQALARLGVSHLATRPLSEVSSGEAHRIVIARALVHDPTALVLDEPTTSLDIRATFELREAIRAIARQGTTIVLVTHHLPEILPEIGRVVLLQAGRIVADGPTARVLTSQTLTNLFGVAVEVQAQHGYYSLR
jgi:iron complex transport system ATP-binding protein